MKYPAGDDVQWWTAWSDPRCQHVKDKLWHDPLVPQPLKDATLNYGLKPLEDGKPFDLEDSPPYWSDLSTLPMFTFLEKNTDFGLTYIQSPADNLLDIRMSITKDGKTALEYLHHRFTGKPLVLTALLIPHQADWRAALKEVVDLYPDYFEPVNPKVNGIAGTASYSNATDAIVADAGKYRKMGYRVNWQASFDFPWFGMFIPPVDDEVHWTTFGNRDYCVPMFEKEARAMKEAGFFTLNYFNVTEVGTRIKYPQPQSIHVSEQDLWKDANAYLYNKLGDAILMLPDKETGEKKPVFSWFGSVAMDPGVASYHDFLLAQLQRHIDKIPSSFGICIDRMDWLRFYNPAFDDGVSWYEGKPAQSLLSGWRRLLPKMADMLHNVDRVLYVNNHTKRIDVLKGVDGIYDEHSYYPSSLNSTAFCSLLRPAMGWTLDGNDFNNPDPDSYLQRFLYLGIFPTAPIPGNDHTIRPDSITDRYYLDYGPLFDLLRGRRWVLQPHVLSVNDSAAHANVFALPDAYVVAIAHAKDAAKVSLTLNNLHGVNNESKIEALYPGDPSSHPLSSAFKDGVLTIDIPVKRGCAMIKIKATT
jgi:hypothetical protein